MITDTETKFEHTIFYDRGKRDAIAETFMLIRSLGTSAALKELAVVLLEAEPTHPHAKWFLEHAPSSDGSPPR